MTDPLTQRLNEILPRITFDEFLAGRGLGNEIAFYIFDYPPEEELRIREHIRFLMAHIPRKRPGLRVAHVNLFDLIVDHLKDRKLLEKAFKMQRDRGDKALETAGQQVLAASPCQLLPVSPKFLFKKGINIH